jgi:hypothetical protein
MMMTRRRTLLAILIAGIISAVVATAVSGSPSTLCQETSDPFAQVTIPIGPALPLEQIAEIADQSARRAGEPSPSMAIGSGTLEQSMRTFDSSFNIPEPVTDPGYRRLLETPVDMVVMKGQHFTLEDALVRPGSGMPSGSALFLVIDSHRGVVMGRGIPTPEALQSAEAESTATAASNRVIAFQAVTGTIAGVLDVSGGRVKHKRKGERERTHAVLIKKASKTVKIAHTNGEGRFTVRISPGTYTLNGTVGADCPRKTVIVKATKTTRVKLLCSVL